MLKLAAGGTGRMRLVEAIENRQLKSAAFLFSGGDISITPTNATVRLGQKQRHKTADKASYGWSCFVWVSQLILHAYSKVCPRSHSEARLVFSLEIKCEAADHAY